MNKRVIRNIGIFIFIVIISGWIGVAIDSVLTSGYINVAAGKEILISPINGIITSILYIAVGIGIRAYRIRANNIVSEKKAILEGGCK